MGTGRKKNYNTQGLDQIGPSKSLCEDDTGQWFRNQNKKKKNYQTSVNQAAKSSSVQRGVTVTLPKLSFLKGD